MPRKPESALDALDKDYKEAEAYSFSPLPNGEYEVELQEIQLIENEKGVQLQAKMVVKESHQVSGDSFVGKPVYKSYVFQRQNRETGQLEKNKIGFSQFKTDVVKLLGAEAAEESLSEIVRQFQKQLTGTVVKIKATTKPGKDGNEYTNYNVVGLID
jgi:hypothetical protein